MKPKSTLRSFLFLAGSSLLVISSARSQTTYTWADSNSASPTAATLDWFSGGSQATWDASPGAQGASLITNADTVQFFTNASTSLPYTSTATQIANVNNSGSAVQLGALTLTGRAGNTNTTTLTQTISGDALNFSAATGTINLNAVNQSSNRNLVFNVNSAIQLGTAGSATALTIEGAGTSTFGIGGNVSELQANGGSSIIKSGSSSATLSGVLGQSGGVTVNAGGLTLSNPGNTYTGETVINGGTLTAGNAGALGASSGIRFTGDGSLSTGYNANPVFTQGVAINDGVTASITSGSQFYKYSFNGALTNGQTLGTGTMKYTSGGGGAAGALTFSNIANTFTGTLEISKLAAGGSPSSIGASTTTASNLVFNSGGVLRYVGSGDSTDRQFTYNSTSASTGWTIDSSGTGALNFTSTDTTGTGGGTITYSGTANQIRFFTLAGSNTNDNTFAGKITNNGTAAVNLTKQGAGKWVLTNANGHTGATFVNFGTLELRNAGNGLTQTLGNLNFNQSEGTLISNNAGTGTLSTTFVTPGRANGGTGNIIIQGGTNGVDNLVNLTGAQGFINVGTFFAGADYAARNSNDGYVRALAYGTDPSTVAVDTITASNHVKLITSPGDQAAITLLSLNLAAGGVNWNSIDTLTVPGIIKSGGGAQSTISGASLTGGTNTEVVIRTDTASDSLVISSNLTQGSGGLTKSGAGTLTLSGANTYTGTTRIQSGKLTMGASNLFGNSSAMVIDNATLDAATFTDTIGTLDVNTPNATINLGTGAALAFAASSGVNWTDQTPGTLNITGEFVSGASLRFGTNSSGLTATQLSRIQSTGWTNFALDAGGYLTATPAGGDTTAPTLTSIADDKTGGPVTAGTEVIYTVTFSEDMDAGTFSAADFDNAGTSNISIGAITETSPGVFTVVITPTTAGTLQLRIPTTASLTDVATNLLDSDPALVDDTTITVNAADPYLGWAGAGAAFDADANNDGVSNGMAWLLGATDKDVSALGLLPDPTQSSGNLVLEFDCLPGADRGGAVLTVQYSDDIGTWAGTEVPATVGTFTAGVVDFTVTDPAPAGGPLHVVATIPAAEAPAGKLFGRLQAVKP